MKFRQGERRGGRGHMTGPWCRTPLSSAQTGLRLQVIETCLWAAGLHKVMSMTATRVRTSPLHHILVVAAVVCCVGLPAVLEVVSQDVVPAVLLLLLRAVGERHWPVGLDLLQRWVVKGHQVLFGARQQLLLLVSVILGLLAQDKSKKTWNQRGFKCWITWTDCVGQNASLRR